MSFFFFNDTATTEIYTLSLHDALPISPRRQHHSRSSRRPTRTILFPGLSWRVRSLIGKCQVPGRSQREVRADRKSTRLNSSHSQISYAVFCLKKKKTHRTARECPLPRR